MTPKGVMFSMDVGEVQPAAPHEEGGESKNHNILNFTSLKFINKMNDKQTIESLITELIGRLFFSIFQINQTNWNP